MPPGGLPTFPSGAGDDAFNGPGWAPPNIMFCWAAGCWPPPTMTTMPATMVVCRAGLGWADHRWRRGALAPGCLSLQTHAWRCSGRFLRCPVATALSAARDEAVAKPQRPLSRPRLKRKARGTGTHNRAEDAPADPNTPEPASRGQHANAARRCCCRPPGANRSPAARAASRSGRSAHRSITGIPITRTETGKGSAASAQVVPAADSPRATGRVPVKIDHNKPDEELTSFRVTCDREG